MNKMLAILSVGLLTIASSASIAADNKTLGGDRIATSSNMLLAASKQERVPEMTKEEGEEGVSSGTMEKAKE